MTSRITALVQNIDFRRKTFEREQSARFYCQVRAEHRRETRRALHQLPRQLTRRERPQAATIRRGGKWGQTEAIDLPMTQSLAASLHLSLSPCIWCSPVYCDVTRWIIPQVVCWYRHWRRRRRWWGEEFACAYVPGNGFQLLTPTHTRTRTSSYALARVKTSPRRSCFCCSFFRNRK